MTGVVGVSPVFSFRTALGGGPLANGIVDVYVAGTTNRTNTWQDEALTALNANPIVLDSAGRATIWFDPSITYKFVVKNAGGATQYTSDNIKGSEPATLKAALAASSGSSLVGFIQSGSGAVPRTAQAKMRERWSLEDDGATGDGTTDDRAAIQSVLNDLASAGGGTIYGVPGKTYLAKHKSGATKTVGSFARSYGLEIPSNVLIDLQGATIKAEAATDYVLISNVTTTPGTNNNSNLGIVNGTIDYNQASAAGSSQSLAFYGVRKLRLDLLEIKNGYNIALDLEACDQFNIGTLVFRSCTGGAFYVGGATASGGAACTQGFIESVTAYNTVNHPTNSGLPGNPVLFNATWVQVGAFQAFTSDAGIKVTAGSDCQIGSVIWDGGAQQNSGFKIQGSSEAQLVERFEVEEVLVSGAPGPGMFLTWCRDVKIDSYIGNGNATLGLDSDITIAGEVRIGSAESKGTGQIGVTLTHSATNFFNRSPNAVFGDLKIYNPWSVASSGTATGLIVTNGTFKADKLEIIDDRATPKLVRYLGSSTLNKEQAITVAEFYGRGPSSNPDFAIIGCRNGWVGRPDVASLNFTGGTLTLTSAAIGTGVTATAGSAIFAATDVGALIKSHDGLGVAEITAFTSTTVVTVAVRVTFAAGVSYASGGWYLDRGNGGVGTFAPTGAATTTTATDAGFVNTTSRGQPVIEVIPTNASARTLGKPVFDTFATGSVTFRHAAAAGTETYQYRILGWTN